MAERVEELKSLLMRVKKGSEKAGLKFHIQKIKKKTKFMAFSQECKIAEHTKINQYNNILH